jgi:hypothetical protein
MGYGLDSWGSIPSTSKILFLLNHENSFGVHAAIYLMGAARVKWPEREAEHLPRSRADVKNGGAVTLLRHTSSRRCA